MTVHLELEPQLANQIRQLSKPYTSPEEFILEILRRETAKATPSWIGMGRSGRSDLGSKAEELLFDKSSSHE
jgi:hypothetical protein